MKFLTFNKNGSFALGIKTDRGILDVGAACESLGGADRILESLTVQGVIERGREARNQLQRLVDQATAQPDDAPFFLEESAVEFGPCVEKPGKIICVGLNYRKHALETHSPVPEYPVLFNKFNNTITAHRAVIQIPKETEKLDYEAELVIVIGQKTKRVSKELAMDHVFGYCAVNDLSARDLQFRTNQWLLGKCCDGFSPLGPYLVTADEIENPNRLEIKTTVNGEIRQHSNTSDMIFPCAEIVSYISRYMTLEPGDIILTGTPDGVVKGYPPEKQVYLRDGDVVSIEIEKLGTLINRFEQEQ